MTKSYTRVGLIKADRFQERGVVAGLEQFQAERLIGHFHFAGPTLSLAVRITFPFSSVVSIVRTVISLSTLRESERPPTPLNSALPVAALARIIHRCSYDYDRAMLFGQPEL